MNILENAKTLLEREEFHQRWNYRELIGVLERLATMFDRTADAQRDALIAEFHNCAGRLPYAADSDYGALLLEATADSLSDTVLAQRLYREALYRAQWCAQAATAGGEGLSRYVECRRIESKLQTPHSEPNS